MTSLALSGKSALLELGVGGPPPTSWETITETTNIGDLLMEAGIGDVSYHSTSRYRDIIPLLFEISSIEGTCNYVRAQYDTFQTAFLASTLAVYRLFWPDNTAHVFSAYVTAVTPTTPLDGAITYNLTLTVSGDIIFGDVI